MLMLKKGMMKVLYIIKNKSGCLGFEGLYPGESRNVTKITNEMKNLYNLGLISINKVQQTKKEVKTVTTDNDSTKEEVSE